MKRHAYYLWLALKPSSRNKAKKTSFLCWYIGFRNMDGNSQIELICISPLVIIASASNSIWVIPHSNVTNIFPEVPKMIVKMKTSLDYNANTEQAFHSVLSHRKQGLKASLISWNKISNRWANVHCRYKNTKIPDWMNSKTNFIILSAMNVYEADARHPGAMDWAGGVSVPSR